jgi:uncharacterized membrane protein YbhN (UPF0104 family)
MFLIRGIGNWSNPFFVDVRDLVRDTQQVIVFWLVVSAVVKLLGIGAAIWRWDLLLRGQGLRVPVQHLVGTFLVGRFIGMFLPSTIGLDAYRAYDIARRAKDTVGSLTVIVVEKITGFFTLSLLVLISSLGMLLVPADQRLVSAYVLLLLVLIFCVPVILAFLLLLRPGLFEKLLALRFPGKARIEKRLREVVSAVTAYKDQPLLLWGAAVLGLAVHGATAFMYFFNALAVDAASPGYMLFVGPLIIVATVIAPTVAGLGAREFTAKGLLGQTMGEKAVLAGHLGLWVAELLPAVFGGIILAARPAEYRPAIQRQRSSTEQAETSQPAPGESE